MLTPLEWDAAPGIANPAQPAGTNAEATLEMPLDHASPAFAPTEFSDKLGPAEFCWPTPPYASYPVATPQTDPLPCEIVGLNDKRTAAG